MRGGICYAERVMIRILTMLSSVALSLGALLTAQGPKPFVPEDFQVPEMFVSRQGMYKLKPLGPKYAARDYAAYMGSIEHLQKNFSGSNRWPHAGISMAEAIKDVEGEEAGFKARRKFTYAVLSMDESRELGSVYISPSNKEGYDAVVRMWVTANQAEIGFDKRLLDELKVWLRAKWPFGKIAYLGGEISREEFAKLPNKPPAKP